MSDTATPAHDKALAEAEAMLGATVCPHCRKRFDANVDDSQPLRLQGVKCTHCKLFVPARLVAPALKRR